MIYIAYNILGYDPSVVVFSKTPFGTYGEELAKTLRRNSIPGPKECLEFETLEVKNPAEWREQLAAEWNLTAIRADVYGAEPVEYEGDRDVWLKVSYLGNALHPSGKFYLPFACSNVAGDCPVCHGEGEVKNIGHDPDGFSMLQRERQELTARMRLSGAPLFVDWPAEAKSRARTLDCMMRGVQPTLTCQACRGHGSLSAALDEDWREAFSALLEEHGDMFLEQGLNGDEMDYFACVAIPRPSHDDDEDE